MVFHYDGGLTGFYSRLNFIENVHKRLVWDEKFAPEEWKYLPIKIHDPKLSVYADEIREGRHASRVIELAKKRYLQGRPDVITRFIKKIDI